MPSNRSGTGLVRFDGLGSFIFKNRKRVEVLRGSEFDKTHKKAAIVLHAWIQNNFIVEGKNHDDSSLWWKDITDYTKAHRKNPVGEKEPYTILQDTTDLKRRWNFYTSKNGGRVGSRVRYSGVHENGKGRTPQRKIFPTIEQGKKILFPVYLKFVKDKIINIGKGSI